MLEGLRYAYTLFPAPFFTLFACYTLGGLHHYSLLIQTD